jgi:hypothetical protein
MDVTAVACVPGLPARLGIESRLCDDEMTEPQTR